MSASLEAAGWAELLALQLEWGADEAIDALPVDRLAARPDMSPPPAPSPAREPHPRAPAPARPVEIRIAAAPAAAARAEAAARAAPTLDALREALAAFDGSPLARTAGQLVFGEGDPAARLVVVAEAPGPEDDASGRPLGGKPGLQFDRMLRSIGLVRSSLRIVCLVPWRPPGDRPPTPSEITAVQPFLEAQLRLVGATHHLLLGGTVARVLTGASGGTRRLRGTWQTLTTDGLPDGAAGLVMAAPDQLLREPAARRDAWRDLLALRRRLDHDDITRGAHHENVSAPL